MSCDFCKTCDEAVEKKHYKCIEKIHFYKGEYADNDRSKLNLMVAAENNHYACLKIMSENNPELKKEAIKIAARYDNIDFLKYFNNIGYNFDENVINAAIIGNHYDCMKYLHQIGCPMNQMTSNYAASCENIKFLKYVLKMVVFYHPNVINIFIEDLSLKK